MISQPVLATFVTSENVSEFVSNASLALFKSEVREAVASVLRLTCSTLKTTSNYDHKRIPTYLSLENVNTTPQLGL